MKYIILNENNDAYQKWKRHFASWTQAPQLCSTTGEKGKPYKLLEIISHRVCLKDKFNNGKKWRDLLRKCCFEKVEQNEKLRIEMEFY